MKNKSTILKGFSKSKEHKSFKEKSNDFGFTLELGNDVFEQDCSIDLISIDFYPFKEKIRLFAIDEGFGMRLRLVLNDSYYFSLLPTRTIQCKMIYPNSRLKLHFKFTKGKVKIYIGGDGENETYTFKFNKLSLFKRITPLKLNALALSDLKYSWCKTPTNEKN